ncbi:MAG: GNAT family protein [Micropepsaceae bacterium]
MQAFENYRIKRLASHSLTLEPITRAHAVELFEPLLEPSLYRYISDEPPSSLEELEARYAGLETRRSPDGTGLWLNWMIRKDGKPAGIVQATCNEQHQVFTGYEVFDGFRHHGVGCSAVSAMLAHIHEATGIRQGLAYVDTRNVASIRLLERLRFVRQRVLRDADFFKGEVSDEYEYERDISLPFGP